MPAEAPLTYRHQLTVDEFIFAFTATDKAFAQRADEMRLKGVKRLRAKEIRKNYKAIYVPSYEDEAKFTFIREAEVGGYNIELNNIKEPIHSLILYKSKLPDIELIQCQLGQFENGRLIRGATTFYIHQSTIGDFNIKQSQTGDFDIKQSKTGDFSITEQSATGAFDINQSTTRRFNINQSTTGSFNIFRQSTADDFYIEQSKIGYFEILHSQTGNFSIREHSTTGDFGIEQSKTGDFGIEQSKTGNFSIREQSTTGNFSIEQSTTGDFNIEQSTTGDFSIREQSKTGDFFIREQSTTGFFGIEQSTTGFFTIRKQSTTGNFTIRKQSTTVFFGIEQSTTGNFSIEQSTTGDFSITEQSTTGYFGIEQSTTGNFSIREQSTTGNFSIEQSTTSDFWIGKSTMGDFSITEQSKTGYFFIREQSKTGNFSIREQSTTGDFNIEQSTTGDFNIEQSTTGDFSITEQSTTGNFTIRKQSTTGFFGIEQSMTGDFGIEQSTTGAFEILQSRTGEFSIVEQSTTGLFRIRQSTTSYFFIREQSTTGFFEIRQSKTGVFWIQQSTTGNFSIGVQSTTGDFDIEQSTTGDFDIEQSTTGNFYINNSTLANFRASDLYSSILLLKATITEVRLTNCHIPTLSVKSGCKAEMYIADSAINLIDLRHLTLGKESVLSLFNCSIYACLMEEFAVLGNLFFRQMKLLPKPFSWYSLDERLGQEPGEPALKANYDASVELCKKYVEAYNKHLIQLSGNEVGSVSAENGLSITVPTFRVTQSSLGKTEFTDCDLGSFRFEFNNAKITEVFMSGGTVPEAGIVIHKETSTNKEEPDRLKREEQKVSVYNQLKKIFESQGDIYWATHFQSKTAEHQTEVLKIRRKSEKKRFGTTFWDLLTLRLNDISNNHGESWGQALLFTFVGAALFYIGYLLAIGQSFQFKNSIDWGLVGQYFNFLDPTHKEDFIKDAKQGFASRFIHFMGRIFVGYGIYQFISAFRKHGKK